MFRISFIAAGILLLAVGTAPYSGTAAPADYSGAAKSSLAQEKKSDAKPAPMAQEKKSETVTQKVKRVWHNITTPNYDFCVACPALIPLSHQTCTTQAKNQSAARAQCAEQHPFCSVSETAKRC